MRIEPLKILLDRDFKIDKKFYFISGNEIGFMEKISNIICEKYRNSEEIQITHISNLNEFVDNIGLFEDRKILLGKNCKEINEESLEKVRKVDGVFVFLQENSQKIKRIKNIFLKDKELCLVDCYELDKNAKKLILNDFLKNNGISLEENVYWYLIDKLDNKFVFLENNLKKILELDQKDINLNNIKKVLTVDGYGKEKLFFNIFKKNEEIVTVYNSKIVTSADVSELYYFCKLYCQLIIESGSELEYNKRIPLYLFKERKFLTEVYRKYNPKKKKLLLNLLSSTEKILRRNNAISIDLGLRFLLNIKKITIS